jgi:hypothetical protein
VRGNQKMLAVLSGLPDRFEVCYEASCGYGHFHDLLRPLAARVLVAHPGQLQTIEEEFADDFLRGEFVILEADENTFLQGAVRAMVPIRWNTRSQANSSAGRRRSQNWRSARTSRAA